MSVENVNVNNQIEPRLQYNYAKIIIESGLCLHCRTYSYEIPLPEYIPVPRASDKYIGKYYNSLDNLWYYNPEFTEIFDNSSL